MEKEKLKLIPKSERYIQYIIELIIKLPRTEKFSIGNEYKSSLYNMLENIMYLNKTIRIKNSNETTRNDKNNFMKKVIELKYNIRNEKMTYKEAKKYLCGHIGYIQKANVKGLINNLFYSE